MIVDTSAVMAIVLAEPEAETFTDAIFRTSGPSMSAATFVELAAVLTSHRPEMRIAADALIERAGIELEPLSIEQSRIAAAAYREFGKGTGHPAQLNFGDCFSYAAAKSGDRPLLFKGADFKHTDVRKWDG